MISIGLRPQATVDVRSEKRHYEEQQVGLGEEFRTALNIAFERLQAFPRSAPPVAGIPGIRRALVTRFPYAIFYFATSKEIVVLRGNSFSLQQLETLFYTPASGRPKVSKELPDGTGRASR